MAKNTGNLRAIPSQVFAPGQKKFDHGVPEIGLTTALPTMNPAGDKKDFPVKTPTPSRFFEFLNKSNTDTQKHEE